MSTEENKALLLRFWEEWNKGKEAAMAVLEELEAPDFVFHGGGVLPDNLTGIFTAFPDIHATVEDLIAEGDTVVSRYTFRGTHQGEFMGIPPTGKQVKMTAIVIDRIKDDKFGETWWNEDDLGLLQQLGVIPQMTQAEA